ncbi:helix-turn-helix domain-containing protein [Streptomyces oryzae]|uniref:Helix-turn-helix domain-containing protein n=1 Tax=Streptomyces oryzae TaxID=1434886 RepID=A0ABS3XC92_9ACTN|nr:helix-turn-helix domain-containing protein [Streptomyces oryzae]MBO8192992.1 helix-turn-helix domain-containing protein [Streptomyces oryzae]
MDSQERTGLPHAQDVSEFLDCLRQLKEASGLTLRQLEERAAAAGDCLPRSTLSSMLSGRRLPRPELLAAFVRACGHERRLATWLQLRDALAQREADAAVGSPGGAAASGAGVAGADRAEAASASATGAPADAAGTPATATGAPRIRRLPRHSLRPRLLVPLAVAVLLAATAGVLGTRGAGSGDDKAGSSRAPAVTDAAKESSADAAAAGTAATDVPRGAVRVRPLSAPQLCVTDGLVPDKRYTSQVAVQRPCDQTQPMTTRLTRGPGSDSNRYRIQWHHSEFGTGCLKVLGSGPGKDLLEPWDACERTDYFRLVRVLGKDAYTLRAEDGRCVGVARPVTAEGSKVVAQRCTSARHQLFRIESARG